MLNTGVKHCAMKILLFPTTREVFIKLTLTARECKVAATQPTQTIYNQAWTDKESTAQLALPL